MEVDGVLNVLFLLTLGVNRIIGAACDDRVAADDLALFDNDHLCTGVMGLYCSGQSRVSGADDYHISFSIPLLGHLNRPQRTWKEETASQSSGGGSDTGTRDECPSRYLRMLQFSSRFFEAIFFIIIVAHDGLLPCCIHVC